jgi:predicted enzyme related to lactoylglutathione lyase
MPNPFVHIGLRTKDLAKARQFYSRLFDWKLEDLPMPDGQGIYTMIEMAGDGIGGGMYSVADLSVPPYWLAYVGVDDIIAMTQKARELGGTVLRDVQDVGQYGWMSVVRDPTGAIFAMWQSKRTA